MFHSGDGVHHCQKSVSRRGTNSGLKLTGDVRSIITPVFFVILLFAAFVGSLNCALAAEEDISTLSIGETTVTDSSAVADPLSFDHLVTGFQLDGTHEVLDCEACHTGGVFDELPTSCIGCHNGVLAVGQSPTHIPTTAACDTCHTTAGFAVATAALFDHSVLETSVCINCHNGTSATGKPANHINTSDVCGACHMVTAWLPIAQADHNEVNGPCIDCHYGNSPYGGQGVNHIHTSNECQQCHSTLTWIPNTAVDHNEVVGMCSSCHNNTIANGKASTHMPTTDVCEACHKDGAGVTWDTTTVDHDQVIGTCESCHDGGIAMGKGPTHIPTTLSCDSCHNTMNWQNAFDHHVVAGQACIGCHDGSAATGNQHQQCLRGLS